MGRREYNLKWKEYFFLINPKRKKKKKSRHHLSTPAAAVTLRSLIHSHRSHPTKNPKNPSLSPSLPSMADHPSSSPTAATSPPPRKRPRDASPSEEEEGGLPGGPSSPSPSPSPAGYIFMCSGATKPECYARGVMGQPRGRLPAVSRIRRGAALFLYDFDSRHLHGPYRAASDGGLDLAPAAFGGRFPAQVTQLALPPRRRAPPCVSSASSRRNAVVWDTC